MVSTSVSERMKHTSTFYNELSVPVGVTCIGFVVTKPNECSVYISDLAYSAVNRGLLNAIAIKENYLF
jgi:hypothetical protein